MLQFEIAQQADLAQIVETYNKAIPAMLATADTEPVSVESKQAWYDAHNEAKRPLWCLYYKGVYAGWLSFNSFYGRPAYDGTVELSIYLEPHTQGKGLGKQTLQFAIQEAQKRNIHTLLGFIFGHNTPSLNLFYKQGFEDWARLPKIARMPDGERDLVIVGKKV